MNLTTYSREANKIFFSARSLEAASRGEVPPDWPFSYSHGS